MKIMFGYIFKAGILLLAALFGSLFADNILEMRRLERLRHHAAAEVSAIQRRNHALVAEARALDNDPYYIELTIRRKLKWVRPSDPQPGYQPRGVLVRLNDDGTSRRENGPGVVGLPAEDLIARSPRSPRNRR